ncbi:sensor histidine kinase [Paenibacillus naphthalenovorans]|uniref:histidine kinase n=1 Tax=Paenibacillus naphthalenovorans TaxID=162209 RepID=A0A0U2UIZ4_9BACL|nr:sensor histidine kinase [Paenibacillus naphthalenovorans]ALS23148.1 two-component system sensor histidine kinase [Paenibacillus naphthalenovorans]
MNLICQLLLHMFIIITPVLLYQLFWIDRLQRTDERSKHWIAAAICALVAVFSMSYPLEWHPDYRYDFRMIPLAVCFFYAGPVPALGVSAVIMGYGWHLNSSDLHTLPILLSFILILLWYCQKRLGDASNLLHPVKGALLGLAISLISAFVALLTQWLQGVPVGSHFFIFFSLYCLIFTVTSILVVYTIRQIKKNLDLRKRIQHNDQMNMLSELAASFAHEIRNPLTVVRGFVQMMSQSHLPEDKRQFYNQLVLEEMDKAQSIINDYLTFAKPQFDATQLFDAKTVIAAAVESLQAYAELKGVTIETHLQDQLMISANTDKFMQCIVCLCRNGIDSMPGGGKLQLVGVVQNQTVCIDIIDHGVGMTADEVRRLGTPYYSTRVKGTGLGMMVTYRTIQNIQGRIDVTSEVGKGTCFSILIPSLHSSAYH